MSLASNEPGAACGREPRAEIVRILRDRLGEDAGLWDDERIAPYCRDWHGDVENGAVAVLRPRSTEEVSQMVRVCAELGLPIVPQGGNTGLVLGAFPDDAERQIVLSTERLTRIRAINPDDFSAVFEAGCILSEAKDAVAKAGMFLPLALGAQGSCRLGGNVSTNAGGLNVLRYGMTRDLVLGLEVVLASGEIWNGLSTLRKDNRGIDLKQLFIGAEGTLGIVTAVAVKIMPAPERVETALLALESTESAIALYRRARRECCDLMSAFELMPPEAFTLATEAIPDLPIPVSADHPAYVLMEISGSGLVDAAAVMEGFLTATMEEGLVVDGVVASSRAQADNLWLIREGMNEGQAKRGPHLRTDVSVPLSRMARFIEAAEAEIRKALPDCMPISYGHIGDGNVHLNVLPRDGLSRAERDQRILAAKKIVNAAVRQMDGSISAEHGIGRLKRDDFEDELSSAHRHMLLALKQALDPAFLLNPGCQITPPVPGRT